MAFIQINTSNDNQVLKHAQQDPEEESINNTTSSPPTDAAVGDVH